jgi:hypothetical protein
MDTDSHTIDKIPVQDVVNFQLAYVVNFQLSDVVNFDLLCGTIQTLSPSLFEELPPSFMDMFLLAVG